MKISTLQKLIAHEKSARAIGNIAEADAYARKINDAKKTMPAPKPAAGKPARISGTWQCSCGTEINLDLDGSKSGQRLLDLMLAPHKAFGHRLIKIS